ncbi:MAG: dockerin type I repeat-containing protein [Monoglobaceae bacterium]
MKKFGFIKKVTAAATAAAMVASLGISAFALEANGGDGITINSVDVTQIDVTNEVYKVTVGFTTSVDNEIGMTMLTYGDSSDGSLSLGSDWDSNKYNSGTMKVIGVDQIPGVSADGSSTFVFNVTTKASSGDIYLKKGSTALIALSGDGVKMPAVATLTIKAKATYGAPVEVGSSSDPVALAANLTNEQIQNTIKEALETKNATTSVYENSTATTALKENVPLYGTNVEFGTFTKGAGNTYTGTVIIKTVEGVDVNEGGIAVAVTVNTETTAVDADKISRIDGKAAETDGSFAIKIEKGDAASVADITAKLKEKTADIVDSTEKITGKVALNDTNAEFSTESTFDAAAESQELTYSVTIKASAAVTGTEYLNVTTALTATVKVTVSSAPVGDPVYLGDVNMDGEISGADWQAVMNHLSEYIVNNELDDNNSVSYKAADVNKDGEISGADWQAIMNHLSEYITNAEIGTEIVGYKVID